MRNTNDTPLVVPLNCYFKFHVVTDLLTSYAEETKRNAHHYLR